MNIPDKDLWHIIYTKKDLARIVYGDDKTIRPLCEAMDSAWIEVSEGKERAFIVVEIR